MRLQSQTPKATVPASSEDENKENVTPIKRGPIDSMSEVKGDGGWEANAAIPPQLQEEMMRTPIKRVGALRRSPIIG